MTAFPIVGRELRVAARRRGTYRGRVVAALCAIGSVAILLPGMTTVPFAGQGRILFMVLSTFVFLYALCAGVLLTADCLSAEKREGTIGLLFLTDLKAYDVVLGKLVSSSLCAFYNLMAIVPMLALAQLLGGVTLAQLGLVTLVLVNTLFFSLSAGLFVSSVGKDARKALYAALGLIMLLALGPYAIAAILALQGTARVPTGLPPFDLLNPALLTPSPILAFHISQLSFGWKLARPDFIRSVVSIHFCAWGLLGVSALMIRATRLERPKGRTGLRWQALWNRWSFGAGAARLAFRRPMLEANAFYWLAARDRFKARCAWLLVTTTLVLWFWGWLFLGRFMFDWENSTSLLFLVFLLFKLWVASEVCMRFVEDRQSGALELILCSPLGLGGIACGQLRALWRQFGKPLLLLLGFALFLGRGALRSLHHSISDEDLALLFRAGFIVFVADLFTLACVAVHQSARRSTLNRALTATYAQVLLLPWVVFGVAEIVIRIGDVLFGSWATLFRESVCVWIGSCLVLDLVLSAYALRSFFKYFRETAASRGQGPDVPPQPAASKDRRKRRLWPAAPGESLPGSAKFRRRWIQVPGKGKFDRPGGSGASWLGFLHHVSAR